MTRQQYSNEQQRVQSALIRKYSGPVYRALMSQVQVYIDVVQDKGVTYAQGHIPASFLNEEIGGVIRNLYIDAAKQQAKWVRPVLKDEGKAFGFGNSLPFVDKIIQYFNKYLFDKVVLPISATTQKQIEKILEQAQNEGWGIDKTVRELRNDGLTKRRTETIVRTESVRAMNASTAVLSEDLPYEATKEWIAIEDKRTRRAHTHAGVDGEKVDINAKFSNGLLFPGDPEGGANQVINCRCTHSVRAKRDENGDIIMKQP